MARHARTDSLEGSRQKAVTLAPRSSAWYTTSDPVRPLPPKTAMLEAIMRTQELPSVGVAVSARANGGGAGGEGGRGRGRTFRQAMKPCGTHCCVSSNRCTNLSDRRSKKKSGHDGAVTETAASVERAAILIAAQKLPVRATV